MHIHQLGSTQKSTPTHMATETDNTTKRWYAMRALYNHEMTVKATFDNDGIECFIPLTYEIQTVKGRKTTVPKPAVSNLIFVHSNEHELEPYLQKNRFLQYIFFKGGRKSGIITVPDKQMNDFITLAEAREQKPLFFTPDELNVSRGTHVRIHGGPLDGVEGIFMKVKGARAKRIVVQLKGIATVATEICPDLIEVLPDTE